MKFFVENHSARMHVLDRDIRAGAGMPGTGIPAVEYTADEMAKYAKCIATAMRNMAWVHTGYKDPKHPELGTGSVHQNHRNVRDPEVRVFCEEGKERVEMSDVDVEGLHKAEEPKVDPKDERIKELEALLKASTPLAQDPSRAPKAGK